MSMLVPPALTAAPLLAVPLLVSGLCAIAALQQRSQGLRLLAWAALVAGLSLPPLLFPNPPPIRLLAMASLLLAASLCWLAIARLMGQRRRLAWSLAAPAALLGFALFPLALPGGRPFSPPWILADLLFGFVLDDILSMACVASLLSVRQRCLPHHCLLWLAALNPLATCLVVAVGLDRVGSQVGLPLGPWAGQALLLVLLARIVLWPGLAMMTALDIAARHERRLALHDELSGLLNRRGFWREAERLTDRTVLLFDIDHFKRINDTLGHAAGDQAIRRFAQVLEQVVGRHAVLGRVGGEEFAAALTGQDRLEARTRSEQVRTAFADSERALGNSTTVSIGVAFAGQPRLSLSDQMAQADRALYRAKLSGRNRTVMDGVTQ